MKPSGVTKEKKATTDRAIDLVYNDWIALGCPEWPVLEIHRRAVAHGADVSHEALQQGLKRTLYKLRNSPLQNWTEKNLASL